MTDAAHSDSVLTRAEAAKEQERLSRCRHWRGFGYHRSPCDRHLMVDSLRLAKQLGCVQEPDGLDRACVLREPVKGKARAMERDDQQTVG